MSTRRRRIDRLEQRHAAGSLERMTIEELIDELVEIELNADEPLLTVVLPVAGAPRGTTDKAYQIMLARAFGERDRDALHVLISHAVLSGDWGSVCSAIEAITHTAREAYGSFA